MNKISAKEACQNVDTFHKKTEKDKLEGIFERIKNASKQGGSMIGVQEEDLSIENRKKLEELGFKILLRKRKCSVKSEYVKTHIVHYSIYVISWDTI